MRILIALIAALWISASVQAAEITGPQPKLPTTPLVVDTAEGPARFTVEMATTWPEQETGMMFRTEVAPNAGMLFVFDQVMDQAFWMKNTLIPLDIVFIKQDGKIARIAANAKPLSLDDIPSYEPVKAVLEIGGGRAVQLGMKPGDQVHDVIFGNMERAAGR
jgi:uncharacterized protein